ncbi:MULTISPECIES: DUF1120 domain-containing protein [Serratia]|uniref:Protein of uncharacterized function (DUF1120) n=1 Tax=Serratia quinivorans TaxID=137545 RepID=A0A380B003_9GAMM|nr:MULTISPECIES: DUF1120 domain-containing protein [Serratia]QBX65410.1 DUF1120 domain-containing protein [Serratia quinivorans]CAI1644206.1 Protein of uncharacterised function (DUF1120) [Serratia quinivorans]SUI90901.1 Protein of uncharacterised function (DUF1120) [Serratia quinivorans]
MKKTRLVTFLAASAVFSASSSIAADSVDLKVIGTITPVACTPTLSGGGTVDYGTIKADTLKADDYTVLPMRTLDFSITCDGNAKVAVSAISGRPGTALGADEASNGAATVPAGVTLFGLDSATQSVQAFGLGLDGTNKIGGYGVKMALSNAKADSVVVDTLYRKDNPNSAWTKAASGLISVQPYQHISWATTGTLTPLAFKTLATTLDVQAYLNKTSGLDISKPIQLDGLATIELTYL